MIQERHIIAEMAKELPFYEYRKRVAAARMRDEPDASTFAAIVGMTSTCKTFPIASENGTEHGKAGILVREVDNPPLLVELAAAIDDPQDDDLYAAVGRYASRISHELVITDLLSEDPNERTNAAYFVVAAIRVKSQAELLVPAVSNVSWSAIAAVPDGACQVAMLEDFPRMFTLGRSTEVTEQDLSWVADNLVAILRLHDDQRFRFAVECYTRHQHQANLRMATASIWSGIEALFSVSPETAYRLASQLASFLEERGQSRLDLYKNLVNLYRVRSKVVHGSKVDHEQLRDHVIEASGLLSDILIRVISLGRVPGKSDLEQLTFT